MTVGARRVRMLDIATETGLSRATVSLVMRHSPLVSERTRSTVLDAADRLGYVYHRGAAALRSRRSDLVGLVMPDIVNPFVGEVSLGVQEVLAEYGYVVVIVNTTDQAAEQGRMVRALVEQPVAGVIAIPALGTAVGELEALVGRGEGVEVVLLSRSIGAAPWPLVGPDEAAIGRLAARHLVAEHGCATVAYFGGNAAVSPRILRERAFRRSVGPAVVDAEWNLAFDANLDQAYEFATDLLRRGRPPAGIQCHSDAAAYGLLRALQEQGIGPQTCRVAGVDDLHQSASWNPALTSIAVHPVEQGRVVARTLLARLGHPGVEPGRVPAPALVRRASCGC